MPRLLSYIVTSVVVGILAILQQCSPGNGYRVTGIRGTWYYEVEHSCTIYSASPVFASGQYCRVLEILPGTRVGIPTAMHPALQLSTSWDPSRFGHVDIRGGEHVVRKLQVHRNLLVVDVLALPKKRREAGGERGGEGRSGVETNPLTRNLLALALFSLRQFEFPEKQP
eukprot:3932276-Rhodomonas_salina.2